MISVYVYYAVQCLIRVQVFAIIMRNIQYQAEKKVRAKTNLISLIPYKYHDFLNIFSKNDSDIFPPYQNYNQKIYLKKDQKLFHRP